ncbi:Carbamoyl-phosphate synthase large chain [Mycena venus]|uniref:Carbamoyl-phosphate synthase large chain n=1 Tax=Mycena venus TaxID=2733690 RepID=A0A8H6X2M4_9AGAR|nr:Carbamoyl-phosphate synthase large chain [Mycena venus]
MALCKGDISAHPSIDLAPPQNNEMATPEHLNLGWTDSTGQRVFFTAGNPETDPLAESLARALRGVYNDETVEDEDISAADLNARLFGPNSKSDWFPYPDKATFLTDVLFSSPRLRFSRAQQQAVLSWARDLGADVPSYNKYRKTQDVIMEEVGDPTTRHQSSRGNVWYLNEIGDSIKKDVSNPFTRANMSFYPEDAGNKLGEVWHSDKMLRDIPDHLLSPNVRHKGKIYYVNELVQCNDGHWFLPKRWVTRNNGKVMLASGYNVTEMGSWFNGGDLDLVEVSTFELNFDEIFECHIWNIPLGRDDFAAQMPHPLRAVAGSKLIYSIPLAIFIDDVSGNKSKQWNKHFSCYMSNGAIPRTKLENEFHGVRASIEETFTDPVPAWDCETKEEVLLRSYGLLFTGDNPMQAELCSCAGLNSNFFCRTCGAGGTREWKQSNGGFADILKAGEPNVATTLTEAVRSSGVKDALVQPIIDMLVKMGQDLRKANPNSSSYSPDEVQAILTEELKKHQQKGDGITNPLFDMDGVDMHKDTPTEILHTILLGVVKYYWGQTIWILEKGQDFALFQARLNSLVSDGLNVPKIQADYMCQYKGGLIGKHFKTLSQIMAFAVQGLVPQDVLEAWLILGRLTVLLWHTEIENIDSYTVFF